MKLIPILFSTPMVQAILTGRKTMTRRIMKPQIEECKHHLYAEAEWKSKPTQWSITDEFAYCANCGNGTSPKFDYKGIKCPYGKVGDVLWVRESYANAGSHFVYKDAGWKYWLDEEDREMKYDPIKWKPSIHMPYSACRIWLKITEIKIERLHDITEEDAIAEGISLNPSLSEIVGGFTTDNIMHFYKATDCFKSLWDLINGEESWNLNPWVWVIEFEKIDKP